MTVVRLPLAAFRANRRLVLIVVALMVITIAKGVIWATIVPFGAQPDEPSHAAYVDDIARTGRVGVHERRSSIALDKLLGASQYSSMAARADQKGTFDDASLRDRRAILSGITKDDTQAPGGMVAIGSNYSPVYFVGAALVERIAGRRKYSSAYAAARYFGVALAALSIIPQFAVLLLVLGTAARAASATLFLTMMPMYTSATSAINPEVLLILFGSLSLWGAVVIAGGTPHRSIHVLSGLAVGGALLTKPNGLIFAVPVIAALLAARRLAPRDRRLPFWKGLLFTGGPAFLCALLLLVVFRAGGSSVGSTLPPAPITLENLKGYGMLVSREGSYRFSDLYWGSFGWLEAPMPWWFWSLGKWVTVVAFVAALTTLVQQSMTGWAWALASALVSTTLALLFIEYRVYASSGVGMVQGRYFFSAVTAIVSFQFWGLTQLVRGWPRVQSAVYVVLPSLMVMAQLVAMFAVLVPRYYL